MKPAAKVTLILGGYVLAILVAFAVVSIYVAATSGPERQASSGMYAFGDSLLFLAVFGFAATLINLLQVEQAPGLVEPAAVAPRDAGVRFQFTLGVDDVDATCEELERRGVELLNGPIDRPWGIRTASFRDPGGHIWEIAK